MNRHIKSHREALEMGIQPVINTVKIPHISFHEGDPLLKPKQFMFLADSTLVISCPACCRHAILSPGTLVYKAILDGTGMRCSNCNFQCHTKLIDKNGETGE